MKGLLIKDLKLILKQKSIFVIWLVMALFLLIANEDPTFGICYSMFLMVIMLMGTISYDDFDNGMGFLMTLPISRKIYVVEKYVLMLAGTFLMGGCMLVINAIYLILHPEILAVSDLLVISVIAYLVSSIFSSVYLPFQLKYGAEKGRIVLVVLGGIIFAVAVLMKSMGPYVDSVLGDFYVIIAMVNDMGPMMLVPGLFVITAVVIGISVKISIGIVQKEEY